MSEKGTMYFFTGLSGAGKTTIGGLFYRQLKAVKPNVVLLDGDQTRPVFNEESGYSFSDRLKGSHRFFRVARMLAEQGIDVVACAICMHSQVRDWNRENIERYKEIYIKASLETLCRRDQKGLYSAGKNVIGVDLPFDEPKSPDMIVENEGEETTEAIVERIEKAFCPAALGHRDLE